MPRLIAACVLVLVAVYSASAQVIYDPVKYQYGGQTPFYYGGSDPDVFRFAHREYAEAHDGFFAGVGDISTYREVTSVRPHVYVDHLPRTDASIYGYTANDARNAAYQNATRYFCKRDVLAQATVDGTGAFHVAPEVTGQRAGTIEIKPYVHPTTAPKRVFIFPKDLLDKKLGETPKTVASAQ